jgi:hypothetical protein
MTSTEGRIEVFAVGPDNAIIINEAVIDNSVNINPSFV